MPQRLVRNLVLLALTSLSLAACATAPTQEITPPVEEVVAIDPVEEEAPTPSIALDVTTSHEAIYAGGDAEPVIALDITAKSAADAGAGIPLDIMIVVDHSGSMTGPQMADAQRAVIDFVGALEEADRVGIVGFSSTANLILPASEVSALDMVEVERIVGELESTGTTAMSDAVQVAISNFPYGTAEKRMRRIVLFSDGVANQPDRLQPLAMQAVQNQIAISTLGFGADFDEVTLAMLADTSGGHYHFIERREAIATTFLAELRALKELAASQIQLAIRLGPGVEIVDAFGAEVALVQPGYYTAWIGEISTGESREIVLKTRASGGSDGSHIEILDAQLTAIEQFPSGQQTQLTFAGYVGLSSTEDNAAVEAGLDDAVLERYGRMYAAREIAEALELIRAGQVDAGHAMLEQGAERYRQNNQVAPIDVALDEMAFDVAEDYAPQPSTGAGAAPTPRPQPSKVSMKRLDAATRGFER